jgi:hypothetical protein
LESGNDERGRQVARNSENIEDKEEGVCEGTVERKEIVRE